jgi:hypothetical protein
VPIDENHRKRELGHAPHGTETVSVRRLITTPVVLERACLLNPEGRSEMATPRPEPGRAGCVVPRGLEGFRCSGSELVQAKHELRLAVCCLVLVDDSFGCCLVQTLHSHLEGFSAYF